jgi:hypothetical protein
MLSFDTTVSSTIPIRVPPAGNASRVRGTLQIALWPSARVAIAASDGDVSEVELSAPGYVRSGPAP